MSDAGKISGRLIIRARATFIALAVFALFLPSCASKPPIHPIQRETIVLLPDASGKTGAIVVSSAGQEIFLSETGHSITIDDGASPSAPFIMSYENVAAIASQARDALPPPPKRYIFHFGYNSATLSSQSLPLFKEMLENIRNYHPIEISIIGHTDTVGSHAYNLQLSYKRAKLLADLLADHGVNRSIILLAYHGKETPLIKTGDQVNEPKNRRTEVTVR